jgi:hypothetical protein
MEIPVRHAQARAAALHGSLALARSSSVAPPSSPRPRDAGLLERRRFSLRRARRNPGPLIPLNWAQSGAAACT